MRRAHLRLLCGGILASIPAIASYTCYFSDTLTSINGTNWTQNAVLSATPAGLTSVDANGGSLISKVAVPDGTSDYEVKTTLTLTQSGGSYVSYFRAGSNSMSGRGGRGSYCSAAITE